jgi:thiamine biosynthesis lipoprotein
MAFKSISRRALITGAGRVAGASALFGLATCGETAKEGRRTSLNGETMGTAYSVTLRNLPPDIDPAVLQAGIGLVLHGIDARMSTYRADSEVSRFNSRCSTDWFPVSADTLRVIETGLRIGRLSSGAFDITVGPAVDRWGFGPSGRREPVRDAEQDRLRGRVDYRRIEASRVSGAIRKTRADAAIDLSGVAKGFAVDRVAEHIEAAGIADFLVDIGGEFRARGMGPHGRPWKLGIERPVAAEIAIYQAVKLEGRALATSGDYRLWFERDGQRYSHIIDPRTGWPVVGDLASVSIIADSAMSADALATAMMVLGPDTGWALAIQERIAALFIMRGIGGFTDRSTPAFQRHLAG